MKRIIITALMLLLTVSLVTGNFSGSIKQFIDSRVDGTYYKIDREYLFCSGEVQLFYKSRSYSPGWFIQNTLSDNAYDLMYYIRHVDDQGLQPEDYHFNLMKEYLEKLLLTYATPEDSMKLDMLLTDSFMLLATHLHLGKVDPEKEGSSWKMQRKDPVLYLHQKLELALAGNQVYNELNMMAPVYRSYWVMKEELAFFTKLNEQIWPAIISGVPVKPGESNQLLPKVRVRLTKLRYQLSDTVSIFFDEELLKQLKIFQEDWGLNPDGIIGKATLEGLNSLPCKLINQLKVNMERYRWMPIQSTGKSIIVNIANYMLDLITGTDTLISMRVIVGKGPRTTPVFSEQLSYIVFSPTWTIPNTILQNDVIPELLKGPEYLVKRNMKLFGKDGLELAYTDIDWTAISIDNFPYKIRQDPGPGNALGRVKFMFPNAYDVYIHDTPSKNSFASSDRAISSGCVRLEKPYDLAVLLLSDRPEWTPTKIASAMQEGIEQTVRLNIPVNVELIYLTAWTDGKDRVQFRKDVYQRDDLILEALNHKLGSGNSDPF